MILVRSLSLISHSHFVASARRNDQGHLEPDAAEGIVQNSLGFGAYEHAPKTEKPTTLKTPPSSS
jgi:cytochrome c oxidase assembly protein subunit 11